MTVDVSLAPDIRAVIGAPGTGKSHYVKQQLRKHKRVLVWDSENEYTDLPRIRLDQILPLMHGHRQPGRYRFVCSMNRALREQQFDTFCRIIFGGEEHVGVPHCLVIVEELRFVTLPSRAPEGWALLTLRGRKRGIRVIGTSQRPAQIDKDFLGNCNLVRCGALEYPEDRKAVAPILRCSVEQIAALSGYQVIEWRRPA